MLHNPLEFIVYSRKFKEGGISEAVADFLFIYLFIFCTSSQVGYRIV